MTATDTSRSPRPTLAQLLAWCRWHREHDPVRYDPAQRSWQVFRRADVSQALSDHGRFSSDFTGVYPAQPDFARYAGSNFLVMDPPRHRGFRGLVNQAFNTRIVAGMAPRITAVARELLDRAAVDEPFDFVEAVANPLPVIVIAELLGIPGADRGDFRRWADALLDREERAAVRPDDGAMDVLAPVVREMNTYLSDHIRQRRERPAEDLTSKLVTAEMDGRRLDDDEILGVVALLLLAGHFTTTALLSNAVLTLDEHPAATAELRADRDLIPTAVDEILRYRPSFPRVTRRTTEPVRLGGRNIDKDEIVALWLISANRDAEHVPEPNTFDIRRRPNHHLSFGHGIHFCVGGPLARLETTIVLGTLFDRYAGFSVARENRPADDRPWEMASIRELPVRLAPHDHAAPRRTY